MTTKELQNIYNKVREISQAKYDFYPDEVMIDDDGSLLAVNITVGFDEDYEKRVSYPIDISDLDKDLETLIEEKKRKEKILMEQYKKEMEQKKKELDNQLKTWRKAQYLELKKEFE